ncbi:MAG: VWA domain-containing protein [Schleiferiaceae bacterium]
MYELAHPEYLWALLGIPLYVVAFLYYSWWRRRAIGVFESKELFHKMAPRQSKWRRVVKFFIQASAFASIVIALSNPRTGSKIEKVNREGVDVVFAVDVSMSMLAEDITPSRILNAKNIVSKTLDKLASDRVGIIAYAGESYPMLPMTIDYNAARLALKGLEPSEFPSQGTDLERAFTMANEYFQEPLMHGRALVIISDGEDHGSQWEAGLESLVEGGVTIFTIGIGTENGGPIPLYRNGKVQGYKKDRSGEVVITQLQEDDLKEIAEAGGGEYFLGNSVTNVTERLVEDLMKLDKNAIDTQLFTDYEDQFPWFLGLALFFLLLDTLLNPRANVWFEKWGWVKNKTDNEA